jgi:dihydrofolate reductase
MINAIFATTDRGGIGYKGSLPWPHNPIDMAWFKEHTSGQLVVMGRRTWDDPNMPKPLPNRINCIFTNRFVNMPNVYCLNGDYCKQVLKLQKEFPTKEIFIIGGAALLEATRPIVDNVYLTTVRGSFKIDVSINLHAYMHGLRVMSITPHEHCTFTIHKNESPQTCDNT